MSRRQLHPTAAERSNVDKPLRIPLCSARSARTKSQSSAATRGTQSRFPRTSVSVSSAAPTAPTTSLRSENECPASPAAAARRRGRPTLCSRCGLWRAGTWHGSEGMACGSEGMLPSGFLIFLLCFPHCAEQGYLGWCAAHTGARHRGALSRHGHEVRMPHDTGGARALSLPPPFPNAIAL